ncbi:hypothetical protein LNV09_16095 [Paucibacter sp. B2R-40]|uniref:hypothetical protein n=1 Tax=Paucibacter sp. B2R-40 TaxID=2893554 RepID=UPI0021E4E3FF|nr:hypothetical protein [Paucibacter sp. B2R-40]MCV2355666.1 hypothetical protein [Paucibacter sp. B2R-40]
MPRFAVFLLVTLMILVGPAGSAGYEVDADNMRAIEDTMKSLDSHVALKEAKLAAQEAKELVGAFEQVQAYYVGKGDAADGIEMARKTHALARQILQSVEAGDFEAASGSVTQLVRSCKACHDVYK